MVEEIENEITQVTLDEAHRRNSDAVIGEFIVDPLPPIDFGRIAAQTAKQVIVQKVREAERDRQYEEYKDRAGEVVNGLVKRIEFGNVTVDLGRAEAVLRREELLPRESFRRSDRVRAYIYDVRREMRGPQIFLSRAHPDFMTKLFGQEVPEIYDGIIDIKAVARDPAAGRKSRFCRTIPVSIPSAPALVCGAAASKRLLRNCRARRSILFPGPWIRRLLWSTHWRRPKSRRSFLTRTRARSKWSCRMSSCLAIGRRGQNVRLASMLTGWEIDILTEEEESDRRQQERRERSERFMSALDVDDVLAHLLVTEGFTSVEEVAYVPLEDLVVIEGFEEEIAQELQLRARDFLEAESERLAEERRALGIEDALAAIEGLNSAMLVSLGEREIKTLEDFADLAGDELSDPEEGYLREYGISLSAANDMIMAARVAAGWFTAEELAASQEETDVEEGAEDASEPAAV